MPWNTPVAPTAGTVITVAWASANVVQPVNWLRVLTGNSDPPGTGFVVVSSGVGGTAWGKVTGDVLADGAVSDAKLQTPKVSRAGDAMTGALFLAIGSGLFLGGGGFLVDGAGAGTFLGASHDTFVLANQANTLQILNVTPTQFLYRGQGVIHSGNIASQNVLHAVNADNAPSGLGLANGGRLVDAPGSTQLLANGDTLVVGNEANTLQILNATPSQFLWMGNAVIHAGNIASQNVLHAVNADNAPGGLGLANGGRLLDAPGSTQLLANGDVFVLGNEANTLQIVNATPTQFLYMGNNVLHTGNAGTAVVGTASNALALGGVAPSGYALAAQAVPSGLIAAFATAAAIAAGWTRYTAADGRLLIGAGTSLSVLWAEGVNYGTSWSHDHVTSSVSVGSTFTGTAATIPASGATQQSNVTTPNPAVSLGTHTHAYTPAGTVSTTLTGNVGDTSWQPAMRGVVWAQKS